MEIKKDEYIGIKNFHANQVNPFVKQTIQHIEKGEKVTLMATKNPDLIINSDGEVKGHSVFLRRSKVDKAQFLKIYVSSLANFFDLSKNAVKIFSYLSSILEINRDFIYVDIDECMKFTGYNSRKSILKGLSELIENQFIARSNRTNKYFINPTIFFNGDRLVLLNEYITENGLSDEKSKEIQSSSENWE
jgi:hypothetical protein